MGCETSAIVHRVDWSRRRRRSLKREREREMDKKHVDQGRSFDGISRSTRSNRDLRERESIVVCDCTVQGMNERWRAHVCLDLMIEIVLLLHHFD